MPVVSHAIAPYVSFRPTDLKASEVAVAIWLVKQRFD
jgi:hypothetical protein